jgi:hypothetical protein
MLAFVDAFWMMGVVFLAVIPLVFFLKNTKARRGPMVI